MITIEFEAQDYFAADLIDQPIPAINYIPEWYSDMTEGGVAAHGLSTLKASVPFSDSFEMGYMQETWSDIFIEKNNGDIKIMHTPSNGTPGSITSIRMTPLESSRAFPIPQEYYKKEMLWMAPWIPRTPKGYSTMITHPLNRNDLPFTTSTLIVDSDKYWAEHAITFFIKEGFEGLIPKGTPMYQMIPFKRESWKKGKGNFNEIAIEKLKYLMNRHIKDGYKKEFWSRKEYK